MWLVLAKKVILHHSDFSLNKPYYLENCIKYTTSIMSTKNIQQYYSYLRYLFRFIFRLPVLEIIRRVHKIAFINFLFTQNTFMR